jgi:hypothetical protein
MKKLLFVLFALFALLASGCSDPEQMRQHRAERSKPKVSVTSHAVMLRRAPYPPIQYGADGNLRIDDIGVPTTAQQRELLMASYGMLQVLRQNTLTAADNSKRAPAIEVPAHLHPFPPEMVQAIPQLKDYTECFDNLQAERH